MPRDQDANDRTMVERIDPLLGSVLDRRYRIDFRLAAGGFGAIYRATHIKSSHEVALKVLHPQLTTDAGVVARFRREGATMTTLRNPHTITAYELGEAEDGTLYIVMELLRGESLFERFRAHGRFEWKRMLKITRAICSSLGEAHDLGIIHRDLKPTNVHLERKGEDDDYVKVLDFGIAKILRDSEFDSSDLTNAGQMIGTLDYMSPEQMVGGACTGQSDIYTLGILTYEMIAGVRPFVEAQTAAAALAAILKTTPPPLSKRTPVPDELDRIVARCLERDPLKRYRDVAELAADIDELLATQDVDEVTRAVSLDDHAPTTAPMDAGAEATMTSLPPPFMAPRGGPTTTPPPVRSSLSTVSKHPVTLPPASPPLRSKPVTSAPRIESTDPFAADPTTPQVPTLARPRPPTPPPPPPADTDFATTPVPKFHRPPTTPPTGLPSASPFKTTLPGAQMPPPPNARPSAPVFSPGQYPGGFPPPNAGMPPPQYPILPPTPYPNLPPTPYPQHGSPYAPQPIDDGQGSRPVLDLNQFPQHQRLPPTTQGPLGYPQAPPGNAYDMSQHQERDAAMRQWIWIAVLVIGAIVGVVMASQL